MVQQERFTRGEETRLQPQRQKSDFQTLLDFEHELAALTDAFNKKVTSTIKMEIKRRPEAVVHYPHLASNLWSIRQVSIFKSLL